MLNRHRPMRGLTLVELLVTVTILGLLMLAAVPGIGSWLHNTQIRTAAESIQAGLQKARSEAVRRNTPVLFSLVSNSNVGALGSDCKLLNTSASWVVSLSDPTGLCNQAASETVAPRILDKYARGDGAPGVSINVLDSECADNSSATQVSFDGYGRIVSAKPIRCIEIVHSSGDHKLHIVIGTGGSLRMCDPAIKSPDPRTCNP
jgi:type IV fimbrial biogenesis protein FimT